MQLKKQLTLFTFAGSPSPHPFSYDDKTLTPDRQTGHEGRKGLIKYLYSSKQTQKFLKTARYNQPKVFVSPLPPGLGGAGGNGRESGHGFLFPILLRGVYMDHFSGHRAFGAAGSLPARPLHLPPELGPPAVEKGLRPSVSPHPKLATASKMCALVVVLFLPLAAESRIRALSSYSQEWGVSRSERETGRFHPERQKSKEIIDSDRFASPSLGW